MNELSLFAGAGGGLLGSKLLGWRTRCAVEINPYCQRVLLQRQKDGILERFPIWDDIRTFDGRAWSGHIDIVTGGFPCQDISQAGKGAGIEGEKSALWFEMSRVISEVQPKYALVENSPMLVSRGLDIILADFAKMGYDAKWGVISAENAGALHKRKRIWILANSNSYGCYTWGRKGVEKGEKRWVQVSVQPEPSCMGHLWGEKIRPRMDGVVDGLPNRLDRLKAIGNAQVPQVVELAWQVLNFTKL